MKKLLYSLTSLMLVLAGIYSGSNVQAQGTNYARSATATAVSYQAPWNWQRINDGSKSSCGNQESFVWTSGSATPTPYMQWQWSKKIAINQFVIYHAQATTRYLLGGTIQRYDGSKWVNHHSWTNSTQTCVTTIDFDVIVGDRVRITNFVYGTGQRSNPNFMEIEIYVTTFGTNNAGISGITPLNPCVDVQDLEVDLGNLGTNRLDSVDVNYTINGGTVKTVKFNSPYDIKDTLGSPKTTKFLLEKNFKFSPATKYDFKIWTSNPNGKKDTVNMNDTLYHTFNYYGVPSNPTTQNIKQCGGGFPTLIGKSAAGGAIIWNHESNMDLIIGVGDTATLTTKYYPERRLKFFGRTLAGGKSTFDNEFGNTWSYTGGASPQDKGYYWDVVPKFNLLFSGMKASLTAAGGVLNDVEVDVYYKRGTHVGSETNMGAWTLLGSDVVDCPETVTGSFNDSVLIDLPGIFLETDSTYAFYLMAKDVPQSFRTNCEQAGSRSNEHMTFTKGTLSAGNFSSIARTNGFIPEVEIDYTFGCVSDTVAAFLDIYERPIGANFIQGSPFEGQYNRGTDVNTDIVAEDSSITYELSPPSKYSNSTFGTDWIITGLNIETLNGTPVPASDTSTAPISSSANGTLTYSPSKGWADSTIRAEVIIQELKNNCDTVVERYIFVAPTAVVDFSFVNGCLGTPIEFRNKTTVSSGFMTYKWDFGDGTTSTFNEPIHNYKKEGKYNVTLEVKTDLGITSRKKLVVEVYEIPKIDFKVLHACEDKKVTFVNSTTISSGSIDFTWDFGDGNSSKASDPTHIYATPGGYKVTLRAFSNGCEAKLSKNANQFARPTAAFTASGECSGSPITINNQSSIELGEKIGSVWQFGDGEIGTLFNPEHTYSKPGTYTIKYKAVSQFGCLDSTENKVIIKEGPVAAFSYDKACNIDPVQFKNETSEPNGTNTIYEWDLGDGQQSTQKDPAHKYTRLGSKVVTLKAISDNGCSDDYSKEIVVLVQPVAGFIVQDACAGEGAIFVNTTKAAGKTTYKWFFGDGDSSNLTSPKHTYTPTQTETFNVRLLASVQDGCTDEFTSTVNIKQQPVCGFTAKRSEDNRATWTFTPSNATYGANAYTWVLKGSKTYNEISPTHTFEYTESDYNVILRILTPEGCLCIDSTKIINTSWAVGLVDLEEIGIGVRPNPSTGDVNIYSAKGQSAQYNVEVIDMQGKVVMRKDDLFVTPNGEKVDLNHLATGVYQIRLFNSEIQAVQKLMIQR